MKRDKSITWRRSDAAIPNLVGRKIAIVGGTGGIGRAFSRLLAARGASVIVVGQSFRDANVPGIEFVQADLSLMREAQRIGKVLPAERLDLVIFTTGIMAGPKREQTSEGIERDMAISYLSRLVILREMAPRLGRNRTDNQEKPRVFVMGFPGYGQSGNVDDINSEKSYGRWAAHMNTVAGNEIMVLDAATRYQNAIFFGLNPGFVKSNIRSNVFGGKTLLYRLSEWAFGLIASSTESYADHIAPLLFAPELEKHSGAMFNAKGEAVLPTPELTDHSYVRTFIDHSETLVSSRAKVSIAA